jgi:hypothetical protein
LPAWQVLFGAVPLVKPAGPAPPWTLPGWLPWPPLWAPGLLEAAGLPAGAPPLPPPIALAEMADPNRLIAQTPIAAETLNMMFALLSCANASAPS